MRRKTKTKRGVYLRAAMAVADYDLASCSAIVYAGGDKLIGQYRTVMGFGGGVGGRYVEVDSGIDYFLEAVEAEPDPQGFRVLLLCMMAACCDDMEGLCDS